MTTAAPRRRISIDFLLGLSSLALSLGVLAVTVVQTSIARGQQYASVWPYLRGDIHAAHDEKGWLVTYTIRNKGIGPALVKRIEFRYDDKPYPDYRSLLRGIHDARFNFREMRSTSLEAGDVLQAGEEMDLFELMPDGDVAPFSKLTSDSRFLMHVVYADVYGNCWSLVRDRVTQLKSCD
jgi:hypothetical protein